MGITSRIDQITKIPTEALCPTPPCPRSVKIEITARCNFSCSYCALRTRAVQPTRDMDFALFRRITGEMREAGVEEIGLFYLGESFVNPALLLACIDHLKRVLDFPYVFLTSNGSLARPAAVRDCMAAGLDSLKWSVNAADEAQFEEITGVKGALHRAALENIEAAWEAREGGHYPTRLYASSIRYDDAQVTRMKRLLREHVLPYVDEFYWLPLYSMGSFATAREKELGYRPIAGNQGRLGALRDPLPCWSCFTEGHVTVSGALSACCFDASGTWAMGDLNRQPFMEAWASEPFRRLREAHLRRDVGGTACEACIAYA